MGVGRLIGKLFGGDAGKGETVLCAYGKLPMYAEYRRLEVSPGTPTAFSQWLDAGRLAWVRSPAKSDAGTTRSSRLLVGMPDTKEAIVATVWDSRDSLGRVFPFAFFVVCPLDALGGGAVERYVAAADIHRSFDLLYGRLHSVGSGGDFYRLYQKHVIPLHTEGLSDRVGKAREDAAEIAVEPWFEGITLDAEVAPAAWFGELLRRAQRWKAQSSSAGDLAVSFPLARGFSYEAQTVLWLEWFEGLFGKIGRMPWLVLPADGQQSSASLHLILRDLLPDDYQLLTTDDRAYGYVEHVSPIPPVDADATPSPPVDAPCGSLLAWLKEQAS